MGRGARLSPAEPVAWHHVYLRFRRWAVRGAWNKIMAHLVAEGEPQPALPVSTGTIQSKARQFWAKAGD